MANGIRQTNNGVVITSSGVAQSVVSTATLTTIDDFETYTVGNDVPSEAPEWGAAGNAPLVVGNTNVANGTQNVGASTSVVWGIQSNTTTATQAD